MSKCAEHQKELHDCIQSELRAVQDDNSQKYICEDEAVIKAKSKANAEEIYKDLDTEKATHIRKTYGLKIKVLTPSRRGR